MILLFISFFAGALTILAPCTLSLLPVILGSAVSGDTTTTSPFKKALTISLSLGLSIIVFTLLLKASTAFITIPQYVWTFFSGAILIIFGLISIFPNVWEKLPFLSKINTTSNKVLGIGYKRKGFVGDVIVGASLGPIFSTCSPTYFVILATVLPQSFAKGFIYLVAYAAGLTLVLLLIAFVGQKLANKLGVISDSRGKFKKIVGIVFVLIGIGILTGVDKALELRLANSGTFDVTKIEQKFLRLTDTNSMLSGSGVVAPEIVSPSGFINTDGKPITIGEYKNKKVVLLDVWTYSCINCQRTTPYLNAWYEKYKDVGLVVIGLHTPEFAFEQIEKNVASAANKMGITYPIVLDNNYATWNAYGNQYWPRKYLISGEGIIVYDHIGEGSYKETERAIQEALQELNQKNSTGYEIPTSISTPLEAFKEEPSFEAKSPETYFGASRNVYLGNGMQGKEGKQEFNLPKEIKADTLYLQGSWNIGPEQATNVGKGSIIYKYSAKKVYIVASSKEKAGTDITIVKDGEVIKTLRITESTLYTIVDDTSHTNSGGSHTLEIVVPESAIDAFAFTFG